MRIDRCLRAVYINQRCELTRSRAFNSSPSVCLQPVSVEQFILQHFRWQSLCGLELMAIALQASNSHTHTYTYTRPWPRPISSTMQAKVFKNFSSLRVQQIQFVRLGAFALSLSMWLIHLQFQSKQTNNLTTYITYLYICMCSYIVQIPYI